MKKGLEELTDNGPLIMAPPRWNFWVNNEASMMCIPEILKVVLVLVGMESTGSLPGPGLLRPGGAGYVRERRSLLPQPQELLAPGLSHRSPLTPYYHCNTMSLSSGVVYSGKKIYIIDDHLNVLQCLGRNGVTKKMEL